MHELIDEKEIGTIKEYVHTVVKLMWREYSDGSWYYLEKWKDGIRTHTIPFDREAAEELFELLKEELCEEPTEDNAVSPAGFREAHYRSEPINHEDVIVLNKNNDCRKAVPPHDYEDVYAEVPVLTEDGGIILKTIDACHCSTCKAYYISEYHYNLLRVLGTPCCQILTQKEYDRYKAEVKNEGSNSFKDFNEHSILRRIGYTVNQQDGLSRRKRQSILSYGIQEEIVEKDYAIFLINQFIKHSENRPDRGIAVEKWKEDLAFLTGKSIRTIGIKRIVEPN